MSFGFFRLDESRPEHAGGQPLLTRCSCGETFRDGAEWFGHYLLDMPISCDLVDEQLKRWKENHHPIPREDTIAFPPKENTDASNQVASTL